MKKYFKHKIENLIYVEKLVITQSYKFDKNFKYGPELHDFWEMVFIDKGSIIYTVDNKSATLKQGQILFHKPNELHAHSSNGIEDTNAFIASFVCRSEAMRFFENKQITLNAEQKRYMYNIIKCSKKTFDLPFSNPDLRKMKLLKNPMLGGEQLIKNNIELLLIDVMSSMTETEQGNEIFLSENEFGNKFISDVLKLLNDRIYGDISIDEISKFTSYSKAYIFKQFKLITGKSIMQYYNEIKNSTAKKLLKNSELSIKEISEKLGFDTPNYFSKTFKKLNGLTPSKYRKTL